MIKDAVGMSTNNDLSSAIWKLFKMEDINTAIPDWRSLLDEYLVKKKDDADLSDMVVQTYWFADYLAKRRRKKLGVQYSETYANIKTLDKPTMSRKAGGTAYRDGHCTRAMIFTMLKKRMRYAFGNRSLTVKQGQASIFNILSTQGSKETQICPHCGSESPTVKCMNGCPYCGTKFTIKQYQNKIAGETPDTMGFEPFGFFLGSIAGTAVLFSIYSVIDNPYGHIVENLLSGLFIGGFVGVGVYFALVLFLFVFVYFPRIVRDNRLSDFCKRLRRTDPNLSTGELTSEFQTRVRTYFLAGKEDNIHFVSSLEASGDYTDVVDAMIVSYKRLFTIPNQHFLAIRAHMKIRLVRLKEGRLISEKLPFTVDLVRNIETKTQALPDNEVFVCPTCGAPISILEGGHCRFCGNTTDLSRFGFTMQFLMPGWV